MQTKAPTYSERSGPKGSFDPARYARLPPEADDGCEGWLVATVRLDLTDASSQLFEAGAMLQTLDQLS